MTIKLLIFHNYHNMRFQFNNFGRIRFQLLFCFCRTTFYLQRSINCLKLSAHPIKSRYNYWGNTQFIMLCTWNKIEQLERIWINGELLINITLNIQCYICLNINSFRLIHFSLIFNSNFLCFLFFSSHQKSQSRNNTRGQNSINS